MTTIDTRIPDNRAACPRCGTRDAYPAILPADNGPAFKLVCAYCGTTRPYPAPNPTEGETR
ncbi:MAG: hypothetical protein ABI130_14475 [Leifsonia sp.]